MDKLPDYRLIIKLKTSLDILMPYNYRQYLLGLLYSIIGNVSPETGIKLHRNGYLKNKNYKFFTHNLLAVHAAYRPEGFTSTNGEWEYWFSSADYHILAILEHAFSLLNTITLKDIIFQIRKSRLKRVFLSKEGGIYRCVSPIAVKYNNKYLSPENDNFTAALKKALINRYQAWTGLNIEEDDIHFKFMAYRKRLESYKNFKIPGYSGKFEFDAPLEVIRFAQLVGLGMHNSIGMGMIARC